MQTGLYQLYRREWLRHKTLDRVRLTNEEWKINYQMSYIVFKNLTPKRASLLNIPMTFYRKCFKKMPIYDERKCRVGILTH